MSRYKKDSQEYKIKQTLIERFEDGDRLSVNKIVAKYYSVSTPFQYLMAKNMVKSFLAAIKDYFTKQNIPFGCLRTK